MSILDLLRTTGDDLLVGALSLIAPRAPALLVDSLGDLVEAGATLADALAQRAMTPAEAADLAVSLVDIATESLQAASPLSPEDLAHLEAAARVIAVRIAVAARPLPRRRVRVRASVVRAAGGVVP